jgi:hypothetical protein
MSVSNDYLHIDNQDEVDTFIEKIKFKGPEGDTVIFTNGNSWYMDTLILNLIYSYKKFNKVQDRKIGVFCSDDEGYRKSIKLGFDSCMIRCEKMKITNTLTNVTPEEYRRLTFTKILIIDYLVSKGYTVLYIDPDMSFNYRRYPYLDFIDELLARKHSIKYGFDKDSITHIDDYDTAIDNVMAGSVIYNNTTTVYLNSNLMLISPTIFNKFLYKIYIRDFENITVNDIHGSDETYINRVGRNEKYFSFWAENYYPNGNNSEKFKDTAYLFHANCVSGLHNKINLLKKCGGWYLESTNSQFKPKIMTLSEWQKTTKPKEELIVQASTEDHKDGLTNYPIGLCYHYLNIPELTIKDSDRLHTVLCAIASTTDQHRRSHEKINRRNILKTLENNNIKNQSLTELEYFKSLPSYKFVISPEGNGIDCHRHYEALLAGCIPIVEHSKVIQDKYGNCPILYTTDYAEITHEYLEKKYEEMKDRIYDFSRLYLSYFSQDEQDLIRSRGNYWCNRLCGRPWY